MVSAHGSHTLDALARIGAVHLPTEWADNVDTRHTLDTWRTDIRAVGLEASLANGHRASSTWCARVGSGKVGITGRSNTLVASSTQVGSVVGKAVRAIWCWAS